MSKRLKIKLGSKIKIIDNSKTWPITNIFKVVAIKDDIKLQLIEGDFLEIEEFKNIDVYFSLSLLINKEYEILS